MAIFKTTDEGVNWSRTYLSTEAGQVSSVEPQPSNKDVVLAGGFTYNASYTRFSRLYRSTNAGGTWTQVGTSVFGTTNEYLNAIAWDPITTNRVLAATTMGIYVSTDAGANWSLASSTSYPYDIIADPNRANTFYIGSYQGVSVSTNAGSSWTTMNNGLVTKDVRHLTLDATNRRLFAATYGDGIYRYDLLTDVPEEPSRVPAQFVLQQNFPNPFNPATTILFSVPEHARYRMAVYDMLGQEVAVLVDGPLTAGSHSVRFDGSAAASGVYLCRLSGESGVVTRKMTLIR